MRLTGWRRLLIGIYPLGVALLLALANQAGWLRAADAYFFDLVTLREPGRAPQVVIVDSTSAAVHDAEGAAALARAALRGGASRVVFARDPGIDPQRQGLATGRIVVARPVERIPGTSRWRFVGPPPAQGVISAAQALAPAERGLHRRQLAWLPGRSERLPLVESAASGWQSAEQSYLLHLSREQNVPRVSVRQLVSGELGGRVLAGRIVVVEPGPAELKVVTARDPAAQAMSLSEYRALAIQTLTDGRAVQELNPLEAGVLLLALAALAGAVFLLADPKRIVPLLLLTTLALVGVGSAAALVYANLLLPVTALALAPPLAALIVLQRAELDEDRNLRRFVTQTINLNSRQVLLTDFGRLPGFLGLSAPLLGIDRFAVFEDRGGKAVEILAGDEGAMDALTRDHGARHKSMRQAKGAGQPVDGSALAPDWDGTVQLAYLGPGIGEVFWLYRFTPERAHPAALHVAAGLAGEYRAIQQLRSDLSAGSDQRREYRPADVWAGGAVSLIARQGRQVSGGVDGLETAVMVFHPIGFPIHANAPMLTLYETLGLALADTTLPGLLGAMTALDAERIATLVSELTVHGGEMRIHCREIDTRSRMLRIAAARDPVGEGPGTLVVEAIDVTEPQRLAQLRLSVSNLLDVNIRNDLEAIEFAVSMARNPVLSRAQLDRALGQVDKAAQRAAGRLEEMAPHMNQSSDRALSESYPIDVVAAMHEARELAGPMAREMGVTITTDAPAIAGFTIADPRILTDMVEAILRILIADTPQGEAVQMLVNEAAARTQITISGGIGMAFQRLYAALEHAERQAPGPFRAISRGMAEAIGWGAVVSYSSEVNRGYRFVIDLRRIG